MIIGRQQLSEIVKELKKQGKTIVFTNGCFDILHAGHVMYLEKACSYGDVLIVGLNSDESVKRLKGSKRPLNPEGDRAAVLSALRCVDYVSIFNEDTPEELIKVIIPDILIKGGDYKLENIVGANTVIKNGGKILTIPLLEGRSTSSMIEKLHSL